jgi:serine/threonine protein kinase
MELSEHMDALHKEAGATVNYRIMAASPGGSQATPATIPHCLGRFRVLGEIARGGMGVIVRAYDPNLDRELAIKLLSPEIPVDSEANRRLAQEARVVSQLHHPGITPVFEAGNLPDGRAYFAMPFIEGQTLSALLADRPAAGAELIRLLGVFERVCDTVAHVHQEGIVHRDLKPANVMVGRFGEVMLMDWGVAAVIGQPERAGAAPKSGYWVFGTPAYMPPEQAGGKLEKPDPRSDIFGLGAILCEILTGQPPYPGPDVASVTRTAAKGEQRELTRRLRRCGADSDLVDLALRCLSPDRGARPSSAQKVAEEVRKFLASGDRPVAPAPAPTVETHERRDRRFVGLVTAVLALGVCMAVGAFARELKARGPERYGSPPVPRVLTPIDSGASNPAPDSPDRN